jgi:AAA+ superfamily predicted ATPase
MDGLTAAFERAVARRVAAAPGWTGAAAARAALAVLDDDQLSSDVEDVADRFGLSPVETTLLAVAAAAETTATAHQLTGLLSGDSEPARPTVALTLELAGVPATAAEARKHFAPLSRLVRFGLVELPGSDVLLSRRVALPDRVAGQLAGQDLPPRSITALLLDEVPVAVDGTELVVGALEAGHQLVWVHSPTGGAGTSLAAAAARKLNAQCLIADLDRVPAGASVDAAVADLVLESGLGGLLLILVGAERARIDDLVHAPMPVVAVSAQPFNPSWSGDLPLTVHAARLSVSEREALWSPALGGETVDREIAAMRLTPEQIVSVAEHAKAMAHLHGETAISAERIRTSTRQLGRGRAVRADPGTAVTLDDLILSGHARAEIARLLDWARYRDEIVALGALYGKGGKGTGICALFSGPPGTGKTLAAHVIADSLGMDLYQVELSSIVDKYIGETEKNLEKVFAEAESLNAVLFFDEADALFGSRSEVKDAKDRYANQEIAYLLQRMEQFDGITVLATNLRGNLDPAFARRLHFIISFPDPDEATRRRLWVRHLDEVGDTDPDDPIDIDRLARAAEVAGGDIRNIVLSAAYAAVAEHARDNDTVTGVMVGMRHLSGALRREFIKLGRRPPSFD